MGDLRIRSRFRPALMLLAPATLASFFLRGQSVNGPGTYPGDPDVEGGPGKVKLPNGKDQQDEILKADYQKNLKDARQLASLARSFEEDLEKNEAFVFSLSSLKKLDDMEKLSRRIRGRMTRN